jgi:hypothetical protein
VPLEYRQIVFSSTEVLSAVREHRKRQRNPLPAGSIARCEIRGEPAVGIELEIADDKTGGRQTIGVDRRGARRRAHPLLHRSQDPDARRCDEADRAVGEKG